MFDSVARLHAEAGIVADNDEPLRALVRRIGACPPANHPGGAVALFCGDHVPAALPDVEEGTGIGAIQHRRLFSPPGMRDTGFAFSPEARGRIAAVRRTPLPPGFPAVPPLGTDAIHRADRDGFARGGHGLFATVGDRARFAGKLLHVAKGGADGPVAPRTLAAMTASLLSSAPLRMVTAPPCESEGPGFGGVGSGLGISVDRGAAGRRLPGGAGC